MKRKSKNFTKRFECYEKITSPYPQPSAWFLPINVRAMASPLTLALWQKSASLTKFRNCVAHSYGFTLMETLITVVILGIVAAILVPNLIKNQVENANRTKVKKAMAAYEKAINYMIIENDIRETEALRELGQDNCQYTREYFKTVKDGENNCIFKTADRVWWDITDITNPLISLKDEITDSNKAAIRTNALSLETDKTSFALIGRFDDIGTLRVNDNGFEQAQLDNTNNKKYVAKLWSFATNTEIKALSEFATCRLNNLSTCVITVNGVKKTYTRVTTTDETVVDKTSAGKELCIYNTNTRRQTCGYTSTAPAGDYYIADVGWVTATEAHAEEADPYCSLSNCADTNAFAASEKKCEEQGARLANLAEIKIATNNNLNNADTTVFSSERASSSSYYGMDKNGNVGAMYLYFTYRHVICVGND